jgi:hypothetical protein
MERIASARRGRRRPVWGPAFIASGITVLIAVALFFAVANL